MYIVPLKSSRWADAYDNLVRVLRLLPQPSVGMGEDMVWILDKRIRELEPKPEAENPARPQHLGPCATTG